MHESMVTTGRADILIPPNPRSPTSSNIVVATTIDVLMPTVKFQENMLTITKTAAIA